MKKGQKKVGKKAEKKSAVRGKKQQPGRMQEVAAKPTRETKRTIKQAVVDAITANPGIANADMIAAVKKEFPESAFNAKHASWYRMKAKKGELTGTPIAIPSK